MTPWIIGGLVVLALLLIGGAMIAFNLGPFAPQPSATPSASALPSPSASLSPSPTVAFTPSPTPSASASPSLEPSPSPTLEPTASASPTASATLEPTASPSPSPTAEVTPTGEPTPSPTSPIPPTALPSGDPSLVLLSHVPPELVATCVSTPGIAPALAIASCSQDEGELLVVYTLYETRDEMNAAYQGFVETAQIEPDTGDCETSETWPSEHGYTIADVPTGRYLCIATGVEPAVIPTIYWTDDRFNILSQASDVLGNYDRLVEFWIGEAGPI